MAAPEKNPLIRPSLFIGAIIVSVLLFGKVADYLSVNADQASLSAAHSSIEKCQICHQPLKEVRPINCARSGCHPASSFRDKATAKKSIMVQHIKNRDCMECHTEHKGKNAKSTVAFSHDAIGEVQQCAACHLIPKSHTETGGEDCGACHRDKKFSEISAS